MRQMLFNRTNRRFGLFGFVLLATSALGSLGILATGGCARAPLQNQKEAMRRVAAPEIQDDLPLPTLLNAVEAEIRYLEGDVAPHEFLFGEEYFTKAEYLSGLHRLLKIGRAAVNSADFYRAVETEFDFYEVYGQNDWGQVFITSYFEPHIQGSLQKTERFSTPLYKAPEDIIGLDLALFDKKYATDRKLRGWLVNKTLLPYYSREEIDSKEALQGKKLELCWVDTLDAFILQIQGSGTVDLGNGKYFYINYAEKNGQPYEPVGKFVKDFIPKDDLNLYTIENYLRKLPKEEMQSYLNKNPSYVFFRNSEQRAITYLGVPGTGGRTIATDPKFFPKGALAFLSFDKPVFPMPESEKPSSFEPVSRFVLDQDIGGAITGGGRVDLFWGSGEESKRYAGVMKSFGTLYYLAPKRPAGKK
ncbi:MAG: MltA domain-containing protein [Bdellovibrionia bacterium]